MSLQEKVNSANEAFAQGEYDNALTLYDEAVLLAGDKAAILTILFANKGAVLQSMGKLVESIEALNKALEYNPDHVDALYNRGVALKSQQRCVFYLGTCHFTVW